MKNTSQWDTEILERLKELGLTEYDAKVYYTLISQGTLTAVDISRESGVPMSKIYVVLNRLENGGWISVVPERPKKYRAVDPGVTISQASSIAINRLENSKNVLLKSLKESYDKRPDDTEVSEFLVVHGTINITNHFKEIIASQDKGVTVMLAFVNLRTVERVYELLNEYSSNKQIIIINENDVIRKIAESFSHVPYIKAFGVPHNWLEGVVFMYTENRGMYFNVDDDEFKMALIIRDRGFLELFKMLSGHSHFHANLTRTDK
jgi:sugar-specific transcriptional regulator TrmB